MMDSCQSKLSVVILSLFFCWESAQAGLLIAKNTDKPADQVTVEGSGSNSTQTKPVSEASSSQTDDSTVEVLTGEEAEINDPASQIPQLPKLPVVPKMNQLTKSIDFGSRSNTVATSLGNTKTPPSSVARVKPVAAVSGLKSQSRGGGDSSIAKLQEQIQEMLRTNEGLKVRYKDQAADIQKIMDQARIHRDILKDLEENKPLAQKPVEMLDSKEILRQEKIRLIREQTAQNQVFLDDLQKSRAEQQKNTQTTKTETSGKPKS